MNIKELQNANSGQAVRFKAVLADKKIQTSSNGSEFLHVALVDKSGKLSTPIFDGIGTSLFGILEIGEAYMVQGIINKWNGNIQLKMAKFELLDECEYTADDFISRYDIPKDKYVDFTRILRKIKNPYSAVITAALREVHDSFKTAPSAEKHHGNKLGGLLLHTYGMLQIFEGVVSIYEDMPMYGDVNKAINVDRMFLKIIMHDIMKVKEYEYKTFIRRKPNVVGHLIDGPAYFDKINNSLGNPIGEEEAEDIKYSILSHHGQYGPYEPKSVEDKLLHQLDMIDSQIVGAIENNE